MGRPPASLPELDSIEGRAVGPKAAKSRGGGGAGGPDRGCIDFRCMALNSSGEEACDEGGVMR